MSSIIDSDDMSRNIYGPNYFLRIVIIGATMGFVYWCITSLLNNYLHSYAIAGSIASVLTATASFGLMYKMKIANSLIISTAVGLALWGLVGLTSGLGLAEIISADIFTYALAYTVFSWVARINRIGFVVITMAIIIIILRIINSL